jgi:hypothetical protein
MERCLHIPIVPVVAIVGQELAALPWPGECIARLLHLHRLLRLDVAPFQIAPPWGVIVLDLPGRGPLPAKITIEVLPAIDLRAELGADARRSDTNLGPSRAYEPARTLTAPPSTC